jgi:hypothetical protein
LGAKLSASCFEGYVFLDRMSWDNFNESGDFKAQVEAYHKFTGYIQSPFMPIVFIVQENEHGAKKKELGSVGRP